MPIGGNYHLKSSARHNTFKIPEEMFPKSKPVDNYKCIRCLSTSGEGVLKNF